jgi:hypothetical protein
MKEGTVDYFQEIFPKFIVEPGVGHSWKQLIHGSFHGKTAEWMMQSQ